MQSLHRRGRTPSGIGSSHIQLPVCELSPIRLILPSMPSKVECSEMLPSWTLTAVLWAICRAADALRTRLLCLKQFLALGQAIIKAFRKAVTLAVQLVKDASVGIEGKDAEDKKALLQKCASTTLNSKLASHSPFPMDPGWAASCQCHAGWAVLAFRTRHLTSLSHQGNGPI